MKPYQLLLFLLTLILVPLTITFFPHKSITAQSCAYHEEAYQNLNLTNLSQELETTGLLGEIHGAVSPSQLYVLSVREPKNFFNFRHFSIIPENNKVQQTLAQVKRHDQVCLTGKLINNPSPQPHVLVQSAKIMESWSGLESYEDYTYQAEIPQELKQQTHFIAKVHAISEQGKILVVEYKDGILPIFVKTPELTKDLYRGDLIDLTYTIQTIPNQPTHLQLDDSVQKPLKVIDQLVKRQGEQATLTGNLVKFPKSPQVKFDVYGMEVLTEGIPRYFTLVNFENIQKFERIRLKLAQVWEQNLETVKRGRNLLINPNIMIKAEGKINLVSPQQANPQLLLDSANDVVVTKNNLEVKFNKV